MKTLHTIYNNFAKRVLMALALITMGVGTAWGAKTSTLTFTDECNGSGTADDGVTWTVTSDAAESIFDNTKGVHYGTGSKAVSYLRLVTDDIQGDISKIVVNASGASETTAKLKVTVGGEDFGEVKTLSSTATSYTFEGSASGEVVILISQTSATKAIYCKSIAVTYDSANDNPGDGNASGCTWELVTDAATLAAGDRIVIAAAGYDYAMGANSSNGEYRIRTAITKNENKIAITNDVQIIILEGGTTTNTFAFNVDDSYLYAASSSKNHLKTNTTLNDNGSWSITIANNGVATIKAQGDKTNNWIRYNANSTQERFSCYSSGQNDVVIYKEICAKEVTVTLDPNGGTGDFSEWSNYTMTVDAGTEITLPTLQKTGYNFAGWHDGETTVASSYTPTKDITLTAQWTAIEYTITYNDTKGATNSNPTTYTIENEIIFADLTNLPKAYNFTGWDPASIAKGTTGNKTVTAQWTEKALTRYRTDCDACIPLDGFAKINGTYHFFPGETITLTVTPPADDVPCTYQWQKKVNSDYENIEDETGLTYTKENATTSDVGHYRCVVSSEGYCDEIAEYDVKCLQLYVYYDNKSDVFNAPLKKVDGATATIDVELQNANYKYYFKITDGCGNWYGYNGDIHSEWCTNVPMNADAYCSLQTTKFGTYVFNVNYSDLAHLTVSVIYPSAYQAAGKMIYLDNDVLKWTNSNNAEGKNKIYYRIGRSNHNSKYAMTLVPGTANLYKVTTGEYDNFEVWHIANNGCWSEEHSIFKTKTGDEWAVTQATAFETLPVTLEAVTVTPTTLRSVGGDENNNNCEFYNYDITEGMKTWKAQVVEPTNGTITVKYTHHDGTVVNNFTSGTRDLAHTCLLTITATPNVGYSLASLTVNDEPFNSGNVHTLTADAVIEATFTINNYNVTWKLNGGNIGGDESDIVQTYQYGAAIEALEKPTFDCYEFVEWTPTYNAEMTMPAEDLVFTATWNKLSYTITFQNWDGSELQSSTVECGETPSYTGATPTREKDAMYEYEFAGWTPIVAEATGDQTYTATYNQTKRQYTVTWFVDGKQIDSESVAAGDLATAPEVNPIPCGAVLAGWTDAENGVYEHGTSTLYEGAQPSIEITNNKTFYAVFADRETMIPELPKNIVYWENQEITAGSDIAATIGDGTMTSNVTLDDPRDRTYMKTISTAAQISLENLNLRDYNNINLSFWARGSAKGTFTIVTDVDNNPIGTVTLTGDELLYTIDNIPSNATSITLTYSANSGSLFFGTVKIYEETPDVGTFTKLTAENTNGWTGSDWDGYYLITDADTKALDGNAIGEYSNQRVEEVDNKIECSITTAFHIIYNSEENGYSVQGVGDGAYLQQGSKTITVSSTAVYLPAISYNSLKGTDNYELQWNGDKCAFYASVQSAPQMYKIMSELSNFRTLCTYEITYEETYGVDHSNPDTYTAANLPLTFTAPTSTREGYTFAGWSPASLDETTRGDQTVTAQWAAIHTITWMVNGSQAEGDPTTSVFNGQTITTLPTTPDVDCNGKVFVGWTTAEIVGETATRPDPLYTELGDFPAVTSNMTFYAVFANGSGDERWVETEIGEIQSGDEVVITMTKENYVWTISNQKNTSTAPNANDITAYIQNKHLTLVPNEYKWVIEKDNANLTFYSYSDNANYLYCINADNGNGVRVGAGTAKVFVVDGNYLKNTQTTDPRYLGVSLSTDTWRCYTVTTGVIIDQTLKFYKKTIVYTSYTNYSTSCVAGEFDITNTDPIYVTSAVGQKIKATDKLVLTTTDMAVGTEISLSAPNITFYKEGIEITQLTTESAEETFELEIAYQPTAENTIEQPTITLDILGHQFTFNNKIFVRSLPESFAVVAKVGNVWYALPSQGLNSTTPPAAYPVEVDDMADPTAVVSVPANADWSLRQVYASSESNDRFADNGEKLVFVNDANPQKALNAGSTGNYLLTDAQHDGYHNATNPGLYEWTPTTTDLETYQLTNEQRSRTLSVNTATVFGVHSDNKATTEVRFLPIQNRYTPAALQVVEWKENSVVIMYNGDPAQTASVSVNGAAAQNTTLSAKQSQCDIAVYELAATGLAANPTQRLSITIGSEKVILPIPYIVGGDLDDATLLGGNELTIARRQEIAKISDLVILNGGSVTAERISTNYYKFRNVTIYGGGSLVIPSDKGFGANSLTMRVGGVEAGEYVYTYPQLDLNGTINSGNINLDLMTTNDYYYPFSVPYEVTLADIHYPVEIYGSNVKPTNKGSFLVSYYDGEARSQGNTGWKDVEEQGKIVLSPHVGYSIWGLPKKVSVNGATSVRQTYGIHRIPMKKTADVVMSNETTNKNVDIFAHNATRDNDKGWNFIGNPYLIQHGGLDGSDADVYMGLLVKEMKDGQWTGGWVFNGEQVRYVTQTNDCLNYTSTPVADATIPAFSAFFIQAKETGAIAFTSPNVAAAQSLTARRSDENKEITTGIILSGEKHSDRTGLLIADEFTEAYEFNADLSKFDNQDMNLYTISSSGKLAFMAINEELAKQTIPLGYSVSADGMYSIAFDEQRYSRNDIYALYLIDYDRNETTNLLHMDYNFYSETGAHAERFALQVAFAPKTPTDVEYTQVGDVLLSREGNTLRLDNLPSDATVTVYDAVGHLVEQHTASQLLQLTLQKGYYLLHIGNNQNSVVIDTFIP